MIKISGNKELNIEPALATDLPEIMRIYQSAKAYMRSEGNLSQWNSSYPSEELLLADIRKHQLFIVRRENAPCAVFAFIIGKDPTYSIIEDGQWICDSPYGTIHRIASDGSAHGIMEAAVDFCWHKIKHLRVDTHEDNRTMQNAVVRNGFQRCGIIYIADGSPRIAYEKI